MQTKLMLECGPFGMTAKEWENKNSGKEGNIRDYATVNSW
jgi:hypothetical protein